MDKVYEYSLLLDFYGQLLTDKQQQILDMHFNSDYSLAEIAEHFNISRQGVHDNLKRAKASLIEFETKLGLVEKFSTTRKKAVELLKSIDEIKSDCPDRDFVKELENIRQGIREIIDEG